MALNIEKYKTLVFDCDGVILNSNKVKTTAFFNTALPYGEKAANAITKYHIENGGVSRYKKFEYFIEHIITGNDKAPNLDELVNTFANEVINGLLTCEVAGGLNELRKKTKHTNWLIASGGDQNELREIFSARGLTSLFDGGIFGSPDTKEHILKREIEAGNIKYPAIFLGDSKYDLVAAKSAGLDFVFLSAWSEIKPWETWVKNNNLFQIDFLSSI